MEETGVLLVNVDGDADLDLYCVGGGTEFYINAPMYQDALFLNDGRGQFAPAPTVIKICLWGGAGGAGSLHEPTPTTTATPTLTAMVNRICCW